MKHLLVIWVNLEVFGQEVAELGNETGHEFAGLVGQQIVLVILFVNYVQTPVEMLFIFRKSCRN